MKPPLSLVMASGAELLGRSVCNDNMNLVNFYEDTDRLSAYGDVELCTIENLV